MEQPRGQREVGCRAAGKVAEAPTKPQGTEKTTIHNQAAGRGESQEDQPTPWTKPEQRTGRAPREKQKLNPTRKVGKSEPEDNLTGTEGYQQECHKKDGEGQHELQWQQRQTPEPTRNSPRGERAGARRAERERDLGRGE